MDDDGTGMMKYRSVTERRLAAEVMARQGNWDEKQHAFLTREKQLQERARTFQQLHLTLRFMPDLAYAEQSKDMDAAYPNCPKTLLKAQRQPRGDLANEDPSPPNIEHRQQVADENRRKSRDAVVSGAEGGRGAVAPAFAERREREEQLRALEAELLDAAASAVRPLSTSRTDVTNYSCAQGERNVPHTPASKLQGESRSGKHGAAAAAAAAAASRVLPCVASSSGDYSSLLMQLKRTKRSVETYHRELSTVQSILGMDASEDLKRTITRMFADPKNADAISQEEFERREQAFHEDRRRQVTHQTNLLREEREAMERELSHLKS